MKTMKIWRKTRKIESHASRFANGRLSVMGAIFFVVLATVTLASCSIEEPDGTWDSMVWLADTPNQITDGVIERADGVIQGVDGFLHHITPLAFLEAFRHVVIGLFLFIVNILKGVMRLLDRRKAVLENC